MKTPWFVLPLAIAAVAGCASAPAPSEAPLDAPPAAGAAATGPVGPAASGPADGSASAPAGVTPGALASATDPDAAVDAARFALAPRPAVAPMPVPPAPPVPPVPPGGVAAAARAFGLHQTFLGQGYARGPNGLALGADGSLYEADFFAGSVTRVKPSGAASTYASGMRGPAGLAFDASGNLLVAAYSGNTLDTLAPGGGTRRALAATGLARPVWPAVDSHGTIYLADYSNNRIAKVAPNGSASTFFSMSGVNAIAIDPQDNLWVCAWSGRVVKITPQGQSTPIASGFSTACGIAWSPNYMAIVTYGGERTHDGRLLLLDFAGHGYLVQDQLDRASSVIFDRAGNVYTANCGDRALRKYSL